MTTVDANRRMRENRMSGGVGGVTGAIPLPRPDQEFGNGDWCIVGARPDGRFASTLKELMLGLVLTGDD